MMSNNAVMDTAFNVLKQYGLRAPQLHDIAAACGMHLRDFHTLFPDKKGLVDAIMDRVLEKNNSYLQINTVLSPTAVDELRNFFETIEALYCDDLRPHILFELKKYHPQVWEKLKIHLDQKWIPYIAQNMKRGISEGCYRNNFDDQLYAPLYFLTISHIITDSDSSMLKIKAMIRQLNKVFLNGILAKKAMPV